LRSIRSRAAIGFIVIVLALAKASKAGSAEIDQSELEADMDKAIKRINEGQE